MTVTSTEIFIYITALIILFIHSSEADAKDPKLPKLFPNVPTTISFS